MELRLYPFERRVDSFGVAGVDEYVTTAISPSQAGEAILCTSALEVLYKDIEQLENLMYENNLFDWTILISSREGAL